MRERRFMFLGLLVVALLALSPLQAMAQRLPAGLLLGKWCGETADYVFTRQKLTVLKTDGSTRVLLIARIVTGPDWISVYWQDMPQVNGVDANTLFEHFSPDRQTMNQARQNIGDKGPLRIFRRC